MLPCSRHETAFGALCTQLWTAIRHLARRYAVLLRLHIHGFTVLGWLYLLSYFKLFVTSTKYVPQARMAQQSSLHDFFRSNAGALSWQRDCC